MTAPTTMLVTGTYLTEDGVARSGRVEFIARRPRFVNNDNIVEASTIGVALVTGALAVTLVRCDRGYTVTEYLDGGLPQSYFMADGAGPVDLGTLP